MAMVSRSTSVTMRQGGGGGCGGSSVAGVGASCSRPPENRIVINVGGVRFETYKSTLQNIPDTRLAWLAEATSMNSADYDPDSGEYFFDRHSGVFAMILNYYRTGRLHTPMDICGPMFEEELAYWGIDEKQMESCCWTTYRTHRDAQETLAELNGGELSEEGGDGEDEAPGDTARRFGIEEAAGPELGRWQRIRPRIWALLEVEGTGIGGPARVLATVSVLFILASIIALVVETLPEARTMRPGAAGRNCSRLLVSDCLRFTQPRPAVHAIDITVTVYFAIELAARLVFCPSKSEFFKSALNWIDIVAVATACVSFAVPAESAVILHQILKVPRILRIFKLTRHFSGLKILVHTMKASSRELTLLATVFAIFVVLCGTAIFICEQFVESPVNEFRTIPIGFWWALVTMTTLGYGDMVPRTLPGYIVGGVCAISGVLVIALPVPIIVNNFALYYTHAQARLKLPKRKKRVLVGAHDALKQTGAGGGGAGGGAGEGGCSRCYGEENGQQLSCSDSGAQTPSVSEELDLSPEAATVGEAAFPGCPPDITIELSDEAAAVRKPDALEIPGTLTDRRSPQRHHQCQHQQQQQQLLLPCRAQLGAGSKY